MGLGKTLQTISLLCHLKEKEGITGPSLVICPLSVLYSWCNELKKWAPSLKILRFHSSSTEERDSQRNILQQDAQSFDVVVTTYEMAKNPQLRSLWSRQYFNYLVLDEGHKIKDANTLIAQAVRGIHRENALILTGTPLQNNLVELWSLLNFLYPDIFVSSEPFAQAFDITNNVVDKETLQNAQKLLSLVMLRRLKDQVEKLMPKKIETKVLCPLSSMQVFWYKALLMKDIGTLANSTGDGGPSVGGGKVLSNLIMQLRKCCLHPFLFHGAESDPNETSLEELIASSGKLAVLDKLLCSLYQKGHRTVLFSQFTSILDILEDYCVLRGWSFCRFDGSTARATRNYIVNSFNEPGSDKFIFLMSTRSGGMGLNLQTADTCILYDSDWNPQPDLQAMARVHRIGQTKTVHVSYNPVL
jgi:SWI/SNF-related matrix-associated actin-dependent regulator of chromatin subfamily A member 5